MNISDGLLSRGEALALRLGMLFESEGYSRYRMNKFEDYDLYARNREFLDPGQVITFTDVSGRLVAMKPDVTLSVIKDLGDTAPGEARRVRYDENVFREDRAAGCFREIKQVGAECFGDITEDDVISVIRLAGESMKLISCRSVIAVSSLELIANAAHAAGVRESDLGRVIKAMEKTDVGALRGLCGKDPSPLTRLAGLSGSPGDVLPVIREIISEYGIDDGGFCRLVEKAGDVSPVPVSVDLSVVGNGDYYSGIVFRGMTRGVPVPCLRGGRYDLLMNKLGKRGSAVGFAVYTDTVERPVEGETEDRPLCVALPKGRLGENVRDLFVKAGFDCPVDEKNSRRLVFDSSDGRFRFSMVKPSDVAVYVERGAADIGVVGKDVLLEHDSDVLELLDLGLGKCSMAVAAPKGFRDDGSGRLTVATKFFNIAREYYASKGREIDAVQLNGSIELAPLLGLSDVIVDIVETGTTLRENGLEVIDRFLDVSARLICGKGSRLFRGDEIDAVRDGLAAVCSR
ncbi:MAG: ATP phosphoribosyltransferase [Clostridia bacterium]|nr:ATP phosphoribosyltransferase [Clostridia bacterium]MBR5767804.1 ATP phosphoribosyltransferase [Clostridia bacterium]